MIQHPLIDFERKKIRISTFYSTMIISATTAIKLTKDNSGHYPSFWQSCRQPARQYSYLEIEKGTGVVNKVITF